MPPKEESATNTGKWPSVPLSEMFPLFRRISLLIAVALSLLGCIFIGVAVLTEYWRVRESTSSTVNGGLWRECNGWRCPKLPSGDVVSGGNGSLCNRTSSAIRSKYSATKALLIIACVFSYCSVICFLGACQPQRGDLLLYGGVGCAAVAILASVIGELVYSSTVAWLYCGKTFCKAHASTHKNCTERYGFSFALCCIGTASLFCAIVSVASRYAWYYYDTHRSSNKKKTNATAGEGSASPRPTTTSGVHAPPTQSREPAEEEMNSMEAVHPQPQDINQVETSTTTAPKQENADKTPPAKIESKQSRADVEWEKRPEEPHPRSADDGPREKPDKTPSAKVETTRGKAERSAEKGKSAKSQPKADGASSKHKKHEDPRPQEGGDSVQLQPMPPAASPSPAAARRPTPPPEAVTPQPQQPAKVEPRSDKVNTVAGTSGQVVEPRRHRHTMQQTMSYPQDEEKSSPPKQESKTENKKPSTDEKASEELPNEATEPQDASTNPPADLPPPPDDGDWVYDPESEMYWSEEKFLFLHPQSNQYYDPNTDLWYDPDTEQWYVGEVEESPVD